MNFEESQRVHYKKVNRNNQVDAMEQYQKQNLTDYLNTHKIFRDLLEDRLDIYEKCIDYIVYKKILDGLSISNPISKDYISGFKDGIYYFRQAYEEYFKNLHQYNELVGGDN